MSQQAIRHQVLSLGSARMIDYGLQFLVPIALARVFEPAEYGQYMLLWLVVNTSLIFTTLHMPQSLMYVLPHGHSDLERTRNVFNTLGFLVATGFLAAIAANPWFPILTERFIPQVHVGWVLPAVAFLWTISQLLDALPIAEERIRLQCWLIIGLAVFRASLLAGLAWMFQDMDIVFLGLFCFACAKVIVLVGYIIAHHPIGSWGTDRSLLWMQLKYAIPFGVGSGLFVLRNQGDQWIAAYLFSTAEFSLFVVGMYLGPFLTLIRESVNSAVFPKLSKYHADGDRAALLELSRNSNTQTALIVFPLLVWAFIFAADIIEVVFTQAYRDAASVMRIFILSYLTQTFEINNLFRVVGGSGRFSIYLSLGLFFPSTAMSYWGGMTFGLWGAGFGALAMTYSGEPIKVLYVIRQLAIPLADIVDWSSWRILFIASLVAGSFTYLMMEILGQSIQWPLVRCAIGAGVCTFFYVLLIRTLRRSLLNIAS